jgi:formylglycine-generating enzyme required for sulfatase activity
MAQSLSRKTGKTYRLLSEAEREYVTRAGTTTPYWWGSSITLKQANYRDNDRGRTKPVDSYSPNSWGLYNVHGNVWEWTLDCVNESNSGIPDDGSARTTGDCSQRILRGGSWYNYSYYLRAAARNGVVTADRRTAYGFRVARTLSP